MAGDSPQKLSRTLTPFGVTLLTFSALSPVVSVFLGGNGVMHLAGTGAALAFIVGATAAALFTFLLAELGAAFPGAGGVYPGLAALLGPRIGFPYVIMTFPIAFPTIAFVAVGLSNQIRAVFPDLPPTVLSIGAIVLAASIALLNVKAGAAVTGIFLAVEGIALLVLAGVAAMHPARSLGEVVGSPMMVADGAAVPVPFVTMMLAMVAGLWSSGGASWALFFAEEMHGSREQFGRVVARIGMVASLVIGLPVVLVVLAIDDLPRVLGAESPIIAMLQRTSGPTVANLVTAGVVAAIFNAMIAAIMGFGRYVYATGRDGVWPSGINKVLSTLHPKFQSPIGATAVLVLLAGACCFLSERRLLVLISGNVADYVLVSVALLIGRKQGRTGKDYRAPLGPVLPLFGITITALSIFADWMDPDAGRPSMLLLIGVFIVALGYFELRRRQGKEIVLSGSAP